MCAVRGFFLLGMTAALGLLSNPVAAGPCETLSYGYVGYTEAGTRNFVNKQLGRKITAWKQENGARGARVGKTRISCKVFLKVGFFTEHECHASAKVCR
jgi:hypothetical protein